MLAQTAAGDLGHEQVGTEHLLLGLSAEQHGLAGWTAWFTLDSLGRDCGALRAAVVRIVGRGERPTSGQIPFTAQATRAIELANVEADRRQGNFVGTEHVLLGLLDQLDAEPAGDVALQALTKLEITTGQLRETVERFMPPGKGGLWWVLRRVPSVEFGHGGGWIDVLELQADVGLRRLLVRAAAVAMDHKRTVIDTPDLLAAFIHLPEGAELVESGAVIPPPAGRPAAVAQERDWTRIEAGEHVLAALIAAQRQAVKQKRSTVTIDDLLLALAAEHASLLRREGWEIGALRALLEQRRDPGDSS